MDNVLTNVQKTQLNNIAIPGHETGFKSDIHAIVDFDRGIIYRYFPSNKIFTTNQMAIAFFEEAAQNLGLQIETIDAKLLYKGAQMAKVYTSRSFSDIPGGNRYQLRFYLYNAYDKGTGHILLAVLTAAAIIDDEVQLHNYQQQNSIAYFNLPGVTWHNMDGLNTSKTQTVLENIIAETRKQIHFLNWARTRNITDTREFFDPIYQNLSRTVTRNAYWHLRSTNMHLLEAIGRVNTMCLMRSAMLDTQATPHLIAMQKRVKKWNDNWDSFRSNRFNTYISRRGYRYEEPDTNEQNSPDNSGDTGAPPVSGNPDTQRGDDSPNPVPDDLAG